MNKMRWHVMIFEDPAKTHLIKVLSLDNIKQVSYIVGHTPSIVSNYFHNLIRPRGGLQYVSIFKG